MKKFGFTKKAGQLVAVATAALATAPVFAGELADAATSGMDPAELILIGVAVLGLASVVAMIRSGKKASGG